MSPPRKNVDPMVNVGDSLPAGFRWFREIDRVHESYGLWHVGPVPKGKTWPAGAGLCGAPAPSKTLGSHQTAIPTLTNRSQLCPACVEIFRTRFGGFVG
jgi:hypothetical protein